MTWNLSIVLVIVVSFRRCVDLYEFIFSFKARSWSGDRMRGSWLKSPVPIVVNLALTYRSYGVKFLVGRGLLTLCIHISEIPVVES